ncbi:MAG: DUF1028 domain-containing protein [Gemmatimonadota bacterium]
MRSSKVAPSLLVPASLLAFAPAGALGQEPVLWGTGVDAVFSTFSIAAVDPRTGESGVAVTTRVPCVGNGVPWVRAGVGAVATQANTRTEYGNELLDMLAAGMSPDEALSKALAADEGRDRRQVGVIDLSGRSAQHTGSGPNDWKGQRAGLNYATQGNVLVGPEVLEAVARTFEASEGSPRHLADRLIEALAAGHAVGGDARHGRKQSAAVIVADPRPGRSRRSDGLTANINVCEHPEPVAELRRIYDTISQTLGYRVLESISGNDVWQLKVMLHALGYLSGPAPELDAAGQLYDPAAIDAVERFRKDEGLSTAAAGAPAGLVDQEALVHLWQALAARGLADGVRERVLEATAVRR